MITSKKFRKIRNSLNSKNNASLIYKNKLRIFNNPSFNFKVLRKR